MFFQEALDIFRLSLTEIFLKAGFRAHRREPLRELPGSSGRGGFMRFGGRTHSPVKAIGAKQKGLLKGGCVFDDILQFTDIAWPRIFHEDTLRFRRDPLYLLVKKLIVVLEKIKGQNGNVFFSFTQRRQGDRDDIQPIV